jgi:hypothetical protein
MAWLIGLALALLFGVVRPGTRIIRRETPPPRSAPTDTSVWFVAGLADRGELKPVRIGSMADFERYFGLRQSYSILWDALDVYFREGGARAYISRVVGPAAVSASKNLLDAGAAVSLVATARGPGAWANTYKIGVRAGTTSGFQIYIQDPNGVEVESSSDLITQADAVDWAKFSSYVSLALGASALVPAVAAAAVFTAGTDDRAAITDTQWLTALDRFTEDLGPGQVSFPGRTSDVAHTQLLAHAAARNRWAVIDLPDSATAATLKASAVAARAGNQRFGMGFAPWVVVPGITPNTLRTIPPSALVCASIARIDNVEGPNQPAAGLLGQAYYAISLSQADWDGTTRNDLYNNGVNVIRSMYGGIRIYGWRSLVDPNADWKWINAANGRLLMSIVSRAGVVAETYVLRQIDGPGITMAAFHGDLVGLMMEYFVQGALYGATPDEAFIVDTGAQVNTPTTLANNELHAVIAAKMSPDAELVVIEIAKVAPNEVI